MMISFNNTMRVGLILMAVTKYRGPEHGRLKVRIIMVGRHCYAIASALFPWHHRNTSARVDRQHVLHIRGGNSVLCRNHRGRQAFCVGVASRLPITVYSYWFASLMDGFVYVYVMYLHTCIGIFVCMHASVCVCICLHVHACMNVCMFIHMHAVTAIVIPLVEPLPRWLCFVLSL